jgi:glycoprotein endo-alpha-1,2-mannosidase
MLRRLLVGGIVCVCLYAPAAHGATVAIFYYPWYGNPAYDGSWRHWDQGGHAPPASMYSSFYPALGAYSSSNPAVVRRHLKEIAAAGIDEVVVSWWGRGSPWDARLPALVAALRRVHLEPALHLEPYDGRSADSVRLDLQYAASLGIRDVFVYQPRLLDAASWASLRAGAPPTIRLFAGTELVGFAAAGKFDGFYTYDFVTYGADKFARFCTQAHRVGLLCAPSVGPGYDGVRAGEAPGGKDRRNGATYDNLWAAALAARPDMVTITSYNEWGESTQIEPAVARRGYRSYDGAWGLHGRPAETAYLARTAYWSARFHARGR